MKTYAIGDVHGCFQMMDRLIDTILKWNKDQDVRLIFLGDYVDRGPHSFQVVEHVRNMMADPGLYGFKEVIALRGNHEEMMADALRDLSTGYSIDNWFYRNSTWVSNGGLQTIKSYGLDVDVNDKHPRLNFSKLRDLTANLFGDHLNFIAGPDDPHLDPKKYLLPYFHDKESRTVYVHAGLNPMKPPNKQILEEIRWTRQTVGYHGMYDGCDYVVHGHTSVSDPLVTSHTINVDTGAGFREGKLSAATIEGSVVNGFYVNKELEVGSWSKGPLGPRREPLAA